MSTSKVTGPGWQSANAVNAASSSPNASMYECAIVPTAVRSSAWAAATLLVPAKPVMAPSRATWWAEAVPWVRRSEKSTTERPRAASTHLTHLDARVV